MISMHQNNSMDDFNRSILVLICKFTKGISEGYNTLTLGSSKAVCVVIKVTMFTGIYFYSGIWLMLLSISYLLIVSYPIGRI